MSEKGTFIRIGTAAEPMPVRMIESLFAKRTRNSIGKIKSQNQNLTFEQLKIYYESANKTPNQQFASNLELLTEDGLYNYVAYLLADVNGMSIKVAKYDGANRVDLMENNEYGYCSLVKATKQVLDKIELENRTNEIMQSLGLKHRPTFLYDYLKPALEQGFIEMTIPDKPNSNLQKYCLTILGKQLKKKIQD